MKKNKMMISVILSTLFLQHQLMPKIVAMR